MLSSGHSLPPLRRRRAHIAGLFAAGMIITVSACATAPSSFGREWASQLAASPPCTLEVVGIPDNIVERLRSIESRGFSICIPDDWRLVRQPPRTEHPYSRGTWRSHANDLSLGWSYAPGAALRECGNEIPVGVHAETATERIGDENVCIYLGRNFVRAYWDDGFVMSGVARDAPEVEVLLAVIRTVRTTAAWKLDERRYPFPPTTLRSGVRDLQR